MVVSQMMVEEEERDVRPKLERAMGLPPDNAGKALPSQRESDCYIITPLVQIMRRGS